MRHSVSLRKQLHDSIKSELAERTRKHQARIAALKSTRMAMSAAGAAPPNDPLVLLAHGDSWFDYPLNGNDISLASTDIVAQLETMGTVQPLIQNISHFGDATTDEMSLPKQLRMIESLKDQANWSNETGPDVILFSGGGNDIAGNQFCIFLDFAGPGVDGLNPSRFEGVLDMVEASYNDLFLFRDKHAPGVPIFGHCYDFPIPNGAHPACAGPWLKPSLDFTGWNTAQGTAILHQALVNFKAMLTGLASSPANLFSLIDTQGMLDSSDWANELHPHPGGFKKLAAKILEALHVRFPGRI
jgi:hypothetical protein